MLGQKGDWEGFVFPKESPLIDYLKYSKRAVEVEYAKRYASLQPDIQKMIGNGCSLAVPLEGEEGMPGFLLVGQKNSGKSFSIMEIEALEALAPSFALAISRALLSQDLKDKAHQMMQSEKLASIGEMAASFVHEIRNPLGIILGSVETLHKKVPEAVRLEMLDFIREESERINDMLTNFLDFAKPRAPSFRETDLREVLEKNDRPDLRGRAGAESGDHPAVPPGEILFLRGPGADPRGPGKSGAQRLGSHAGGGILEDFPRPESGGGGGHPGERHGRGHSPRAPSRKSSIPFSPPKRGERGWGWRSCTAW